MATLSRVIRIAAILAVVTLIASCNPTSQASPTQTVCDGVSSELGGCTADRHTFTGSTCEELAHEWALVLDPAVRAVIDGPATVAGEGRGPRLKQAVVITTIDMHARMQDLDIESECSAPAFLDVAEPDFSPALRSAVGGAMYDGDPPATYLEWLDDVRRTLRLIDPS